MPRAAGDIMKPMEHPPRHMSPLQDRLTFHNSLPKAAFSVTFSRAMCTNNTQAKHELCATILQTHSEYFFPYTIQEHPVCFHEPVIVLQAFYKSVLGYFITYKTSLPASCPRNQAHWTLIRRRQDSMTVQQRQKHCSVIKLVNCWSPHGAQTELTEPPGWMTIY